MQNVRELLTSLPAGQEKPPMRPEQSKRTHASPDNVEALFQEFEVMYGSRFIEMWKTANADLIKQRWGEALAGFSVREVRQGLAACRAKPWPPTLPEFLLLCRPKPDYEAMFHEAQKQAGQRRYGSDTWESPLLFWAAYRMGTDDMVNLPWEKARVRWVKIIDELRPQADMLAPVPEKSPALAYVPKQVTETAKRSIMQCRQILGMPA